MKNVMVLLTVLVAAITTGCGGSMQPTQPKPTPAPQTSTIPRTGTIFVGDSIFGKWDLDSYFPGKGYVNAGWFGQRTDQILAVFPAILDGSKVCHGYIPTAPNPPDPSAPFVCATVPPPAEVVILLGWNDMFQGFDTKQAAANIRAMANQSLAAGVKVVLVVPYRYDSAHPAPWMQPWDSCSDMFPFRDNQEPVLNSSIRNTAAELKIPVVDMEKLFTCQSDYTVDGVHPNASGYVQMHGLLAKSL